MPAISASLEYLQRLEMYKTEKPYWCFLPPHEGFDPNKQRVDNLEFEEHNDITIQDMREMKSAFNIDDCGFQVLDHASQYSTFEAASDVQAYQRETEQLLREEMHADYVLCYDTRLRVNVPFQRDQMDLNDLTLREGPARGVHNDITMKSGPEVIQRYLSEDTKAKYLRPGSRARIRIVNTWRTLNPVLEDRPLALCDGRTVLTDDLAPTDRIIPSLVGEVYYLYHNPNHKWFWLEKQTSSEPFAFVMYDTKAGKHSRSCPHVSFVNSRSPDDAPPRKSIETRSIVITRSC